VAGNRRRQVEIDEPGLDACAAIAHVELEDASSDHRDDEAAARGDRPAAETNRRRAVRRLTALEAMRTASAASRTSRDHAAVVDALRCTRRTHTRRDLPENSARSGRALPEAEASDSPWTGYEAAASS